jgi:hypothetical protein
MRVYTLLITSLGLWRAEAAIDDAWKDAVCRLPTSKCTFTDQNSSKHRSKTRSIPRFKHRSLRSFRALSQRPLRMSSTSSSLALRPSKHKFSHKQRLHNKRRLRLNQQPRNRLLRDRHNKRLRMEHSKPQRLQLIKLPQHKQRPRKVEMVAVTAEGKLPIMQQVVLKQRARGSLWMEEQP